jgi:hypothetical protein
MGNLGVKEPYAPIVNAMDPPRNGKGGAVGGDGILAAAGEGAECVFVETSRGWVVKVEVC